MPRHNKTERATPYFAEGEAFQVGYVCSSFDAVTAFVGTYRRCSGRRLLALKVRLKVDFFVVIKGVVEADWLPAATRQNKKQKQKKSASTSLCAMHERPVTALPAVCLLFTADILVDTHFYQEKCQQAQGFP